MQTYTPLSSKKGVFIVKHGFEGDTASYFPVAAPECTRVVVAKVIFHDMAVALGQASTEQGIVVSLFLIASTLFVIQ